MATTPKAQDGADPRNDLFDLVTRAAKVAFYQWIPGSDELNFSPAMRDMFGYDPGAWTVSRAWETIHLDDQPGYRAARIAYLKGHEDQAEFVWRTRIAGGSWRWLRDQTVVERDAAGRVTRLVGAVSDITEAKEHALALAEREAENRALIARQAASIEVLQAISANGEPGRGTVGCVTVYPSSRNVAPGRVWFSVDTRHGDPERLAWMGAEIKARAAKLAEQRQLKIDIVDFWQSPLTPFAPELAALLRTAAQARGYRFKDMPTGIGHDAVYMARKVPSVMLFCPCHGGISHNEAESITPEWATAGLTVLADAVLAAANAPA